MSRAKCVAQNRLRCRLVDRREAMEKTLLIVTEDEMIYIGLMLVDDEIQRFR